MCYLKCYIFYENYTKIEAKAREILKQNIKLGVYLILVCGRPIFNLFFK